MYSNGELPSDQAITFLVNLPRVTFFNYLCICKLLCNPSQPQLLHVVLCTRWFVYWLLSLTNATVAFSLLQYASHAVYTHIFPCFLKLKYIASTLYQVGLLMSHIRNPLCIVFTSKTGFAALTMQNSLRMGQKVKLLCCHIIKNVKNEQNILIKPTNTPDKYTVMEWLSYTYINLNEELINITLHNPVP